MAMSLSDAEAIFKSEAFKGWQKWREAESNMQGHIIERLDGVIKSIHALGKRRR